MLDTKRPPPGDACPRVWLGQDAGSPPSFTSTALAPRIITAWHPGYHSCLRWLAGRIRGGPRRGTEYLAVRFEIPAITLASPTSAPRLLLRRQDARPNLLSALVTSNQDLARRLPGVAPFGLVPADMEDATAPSALANLYLPCLRLLLVIRRVASVLRRGANAELGLFLDSRGHASAFRLLLRCRGVIG